MNPDDYKKRDWLKDIYSHHYENTYLEHLEKNYKDLYGRYEKPKHKYDPWSADLDPYDDDYTQTRPARFGIGDLLSAGGIVALVVSVVDGLNGWKYGVMRDGELMNVDEVALGEWSSI